jgi:hypothetical protein
MAGWSVKQSAHRLILPGLENIDSSTYVQGLSTAISLRNIAKTQLDYGTDRLADGLRFSGTSDIVCVVLAEIGSKHYGPFGQKLLNTAGQSMQEIAC